MTLIQQRIAQFKAQRRVQAGSLIMSVFGDAIVPRGGRVWLGSIIRLLAPLGISERLVRTAAFRLVQEGWLATQAYGRRSDYTLTDAGRRRFDEASRHIYAAAAPAWDGQWRLILGVGDISGKAREQLRRALYWQGFGSLGDSFIHPGADLPAVLDALHGEGLGALIDQLLPLMGRDIRTQHAGSDRQLVSQAWNLGHLADAYASFVHTYQALADALPDLDGVAEDAFLLRLLLIHDYRRLLLRDPELPAELLPAAWPGQTAREICARLYRTLLPASERHLDGELQWASGQCLPPLTVASPRFCPTTEG